MGKIIMVTLMLSMGAKKRSGHPLMDLCVSSQTDSVSH